MAWESECVRILRYLIDDLGTSPDYSDTRLQETFIVAAQLVKQEVEFTTTYSIDVDQLLLSPDPTDSPKDNAFINLVCLKAGCIITRSEMRAKAKTGGILVKDGQSTINTQGQIDGYKVLLEKGLCQEYESAKKDYLLGDLVPGRAVCGALSGPNIFSDNFENDRRNTFN